MLQHFYVYAEEMLSYSHIIKNKVFHSFTLDIKTTQDGLLQEICVKNKNKNIYLTYLSNLSLTILLIIFFLYFMMNIYFNEKLLKNSKNKVIGQKL